MIKGIVIGFILAIAIQWVVFSFISLLAWRQSRRPIHLCRLRGSSRIWLWMRKHAGFQATQNRRKKALAFFEGSARVGL